MTARAAVAGFLDANRRVSAAIERRLPHAEALWPVYDRTVADIVERRDGQLVVDVGAGLECSFARLLANRDRTTIVGVDVASEALERNRDLDRFVVADASSGLPFPQDSVDVIVSRTTLEHLPDVASFFANCRRVLKPGGSMAHVFSCRYAPFAVLNRALPERFSGALLARLKPECAGECGYHAFYDRCYHSAIRDSVVGSGFELVELRSSFYQSWYVDFFVPLYLASAAYELSARAAGLDDLAAYLLVVARRPVP